MKFIIEKIFFLIIFVISPNICFSQFDSVFYYFDEYQDFCPKEKATYIGKGIKENGQVKLSYYTPAGILLMEQTYSDSTLSNKNGPFNLYSELEKRMIKKGNYLDDKEDGYWIYWENGLLTDSVLYETGMDNVRISYSYHKNGLLMSRISNDARNKTSEITIFDSEGNAERITKWVNGSGDQVYYYPNGQRKTVETFKDKKIVHLKHYWPDGTEITQKEFKKNQTKINEEYRKHFEEKTPSFAGGNAGFRSYFEKNFKAPLNFFSSIRNAVGISVTFYLNKNGYAYDIVVEESMSFELRTAINEAFKNMPPWNMKGFDSYGPIRFNISLNRGY